MLNRGDDYHFPGDARTLNRKRSASNTNSTEDEPKIVQTLSENMHSNRLLRHAPLPLTGSISGTSVTNELTPPVHHMAMVPFTAVLAQKNNLHFLNPSCLAIIVVLN